MKAVGEAGAAAGSRRGRLSMRRALGLSLIALLLLAALAQLLLPRIAARVLREKVTRYGDVRSAGVTALPALQLLWGSADSAHLAAGRLRISLHEVARLLAESRPVTEVTATARAVELVRPGFGVGAVTLSDAVLEKRGDAVEMRALLTRPALKAALPAGVRIDVLRSDGGVTLAASGGLLGLRRPFRARLQVAGGRLLLAPQHPLLAGAARLTLFADRRLELLGVSAVPLEAAAGSESARGGWLLSISARLR